jgi:RNA polymerase sigma-70 factor (ECF subfamily)
VFSAHHAYVLHSLRRLGVPERDLEDVAHDTFIVVHRKLAEYDPARPLKPFLFGIAFRVALDYRRRARHRYERTFDADSLNQVTDAPTNARSPEQQLHVSQAQQLAVAALRQLEPERSAVLVMMDIDACTAPEVAATLEVPLNTVYSRLRLARAEFADAVKRLQTSGGRR